MWTLAVPYFYPSMDAISIEHVYNVLIENTAEEENVENINKYEKDCKIRWNSRDFQTMAIGIKMRQTSPETFSNFHFLEIPNPPPENSRLG
jgi:fatty-acid desaturase